ncbi:holocytochrome c synthase [Mycoemilia scoparia]|uniref:Holocytochrome c-type synthase n=1 Tax=Mycoemilia scoparia TaxID=417184 RepID=A0A9W8A7B2_9FUNG|nr:holocytochrome c synthase [Mycoemilia scoparia]
MSDIQVPLLFELTENDLKKQNRGAEIQKSPNSEIARKEGNSSSAPTAQSRCPVNHGEIDSYAQAPHDANNNHHSSFIHQSSLGLDPKPKCPVDHGSGGDKINPLNMMPENLSQSVKYQQQTKPLPTERDLSTIPRPSGAVDYTRPSNSSIDKNAKDSGNEVWEYPSPQQFYNALARKGMPAPEDDIEMMVQIHNFLNEGAWQEVLKWEAMHNDECPFPRLERLQGRPNELSPKARIYGWLYGTKPFDRHDWYVNRCGKQVRYVIDYYDAPPEGDMPAFHLDIRPALDSFEALKDRAKVTFDEFKQKYLNSGNNTE